MIRAKIELFNTLYEGDAAAGVIADFNELFLGKMKTRKPTIALDLLIAKFQLLLRQYVTKSFGGEFSEINVCSIPGDKDDMEMLQLFFHNRFKKLSNLSVACEMKIIYDQNSALFKQQMS